MASAKKCSTVVGVFEDRHHADQAVSDLRKAGFRDDQIGVAMRHDEGVTESSTSADAEDSHAGSGALAGALTGLGLGALAGLGVLAGVIPVVGPAIAGGTLGVILSNAAAGAGLAGLAGALLGYGIPEEEAKFYHGEFEAGRTIVTVTADGRCDEATSIMRQHGGYDMSTRPASASDAASKPKRPRARSAFAAGDTIHVKEERLHAEKRPVKAGEVRVRKEAHTETETLNVPVQREEVVIERTPVHDRAATEGIVEGDEIRIPVREEQVKVSKEAVVTEEVKVGKRVVQGTERVSGKVRKEKVKVEKKGDADVRPRGKGKSKDTV